MKKFCEDLEKLVTRIFNYEKKEMMPLTKKRKNIINKKSAIHAKKDLVLMLTIKSKRPLSLY